MSTASSVPHCGVVARPKYGCPSLVVQLEVSRAALIVIATGVLVRDLYSRVLTTNNRELTSLSTAASSRSLRRRETRRRKAVTVKRRCADLFKQPNSCPSITLCKRSPSKDVASRHLRLPSARNAKRCDCLLLTTRFVPHTLQHTACVVHHHQAETP